MYGLLLLNLCVASLYAQDPPVETDIFVASDAASLLSINALVEHPETGNWIGVATTSTSAGEEHFPLLLKNEDFAYPGLQDLSFIGGGGFDGLVFCLSTTGEFKWVFPLGSAGNDTALDVCPGPDGSCFVTGYYGGDMSITDATGVAHTVTYSNPSTDPSEVLVLSIDADGGINWTKHYGGDGVDLGRRVSWNGTSLAVLGAVDPGEATFDSFTLDWSSATVNGEELDTDDDGADFFLVSLNPESGTTEWLRTWGSPSSDYSGPRYQLANVGLDYSEDRWLTSFPWSGSICVFRNENGDQLAEINSLDNDEELGVASLNFNGDFTWTRAVLFGGGDHENVTDLTVSGESVLVAGTSDIVYWQSIWNGSDTSISSKDPFVLSINIDGGSKEWVRFYETGDGSIPESVRVQHLNTGTGGEVIMSGFMEGELNAGDGVFLSGLEDIDGFQLALTNQGEPLWAWNSGLPGNDLVIAHCIVGDQIRSTGMSTSNTIDSNGPTTPWLEMPIGNSVLCATPPVAGEASAVELSVCANEEANLKTSGAKGNLQWQKLWSDGQWYDVDGATDSLLTYTITEDLSFRVIAASPDCYPDTSNAVQVVLGTTVAQVNCPISTQTLDWSDGNLPGAVVPDYSGFISVSGCPDAGWPQQIPAAGTNLSAGSHNIQVGYSNGVDINEFCTVSVNVTPTFDYDIELNVTDLVLNEDCQALIPNYAEMASISGVSDADSWNIVPVYVLGDPQFGNYADASEFPYSFSLFATGPAGSVQRDFEVNAVDNAPPVITCDNTYAPLMDSNCEWLGVFEELPISVADACTPASGLSWSFSPNILTVQPATLDAALVTVEDAAGQTASCMLSIDPTDILGPQMSCPDAPMTYTLPADGTGWAMPDFTALVAPSDCSGMSTSWQSLPAGNLYDQPEAAQVTVNAEDVSGNPAVCVIDWVLVDETAPVILSATVPTLYADGNCSAVLPDLTGGVVVTDNSGVALVVSQDPPAGSTVTHGEPLTFEVSDGTLTAFLDTTITVIDNAPPEMVCPALITHYLTEDCSGFVEDYTNQVTVSDNCDPFPVLQQISPAVGTELFASETLQSVLFEARDNASPSNSFGCSVALHVVDSVVPDITCPAPILLSTSSWGCLDAWPDLTGLVEVSSNCAVDYDLEQDIAASSPAESGYHDVVFTLSRQTEISLVTQCTTQVAYVNDVPFALESMPDDQWSPTGAGCSEVVVPDYMLSASVTGCVPYNLSQNPAPGTYTASEFTFPLTVVVSATSTLDANEVAETQFSVDLSEVPAGLVFSDGAVEVGMDCLGTLPNYLPEGGIMDLCGTPAVLAQSPQAGTAFSVGASVEVTISFQSDGTTYDTFTVGFTDGSTPVWLNCPGGNLVQELVLAQDACTTVPGGPVATDACSAVDVTWTSGTPLDQALEAGTYTSHYSATDAFNNTISCTIATTILDESPPVWEDCPGGAVDLTWSTDPSTCEATGVLPEATDGCGTVDLTWISGTPLDVPLGPGNYSSAYHATDQAGNASTCAVNVAVVDDTAPIWDNCPGGQVDQEWHIDAGECTFTGTAPVASDDCSEVTVALLEGTALDQPLAAGSYTATYEATDGFGQASTCVVHVDIMDVTPPDWMDCPLGTIEMEVAIPEGACETSAMPPVAVDGCSGVNVQLTSGQDLEALMESGSYTSVYTATDESGNPATCVVETEVVDITPPEITCPDVQTSCDLQVMYSAPQVFSPCGEVLDVVQLEPVGLSSGMAWPEGTHDLVFQVSDGFNNAATCTTSVAPFVDLPIPIIQPIVRCESDEAFTVQLDNWDGATAWNGDISPDGTIDPADIGPGTHTFEVVIGTGDCTEQLDFTYSIDSLPTAELNVPDALCDQADPVLLGVSTGATWMWDAPVADDGSLDPSDLPPGTEATVGGTATSGACSTSVSASIAVIPWESVDWTLLPAALCANDLPVGMSVTAFEGLQWEWNEWIDESEAFDPAVWGAGNYTIACALEGGGCTMTLEQDVLVHALPEVSAGPDGEVCGTSVQLSGESNNPEAEYQWSGLPGVVFDNPASAAPWVTVPNPGAFTLTLAVTGPNGCTAVDGVGHVFHALPSMPDAGMDQELENVTATSLTGWYTGPGSHQWIAVQTPAVIEQPYFLTSEVTQLKSGKNTFHLKVTNGNCPPVVDSINVFVNQPFTIPTGFSPNGDMVNDVFVVKGLRGPAQLTVFNRWGAVVFAEQRYRNNWNGIGMDGNPLPDDTYFYQLGLGKDVYDGFIIIKR